MRSGGLRRRRATLSGPQRGPRDRAAYGRGAAHRGPDDAGAGRRRGRRRARPPPTVDHRPLGRRASADGVGRRPLCDRLQRRDLQLPRAAARARRAGQRLSRALATPRCCSPRSSAGGSRRRSQRSTACSPSRSGTGSERTLHLVARPARREAALLWLGRAARSLFGSELKALRAHPAFAPEIDRDALDATSCATAMCRRRTRSTRASASCRRPHLR